MENRKENCQCSFSLASLLPKFKSILLLLITPHLKHMEFSVRVPRLPELLGYAPEIDLVLTEKRQGYCSSASVFAISTRRKLGLLQDHMKAITFLTIQRAQESQNCFASSRLSCTQGEDELIPGKDT